MSLNRYVLTVITLESDFVDTPITITISPGDTSAVVFIPIIDDNLVERNEVFDVVLRLQGNEVTIGDFERANVIIDDNDVGKCMCGYIYILRKMDHVPFQSKKNAFSGT